MAGPLGNAAKDGDIGEIERLLNEGADVNESGLASPLFYAIQYNHTDAARLLIERGADVNKASTWGTPIHEAAKRGNAEIVRLLLEQGADPSVTASKGMTPLHSAAEGGSVESAQYLLDHKADVNALTTLDEPPIHYARLKGHEAVAQLLIDHGWAPPEVPPISGLLASADVSKGELQAKGCAGGCHTFEKGKNDFGPSLWNIVGQPKGSAANFDYSPTFASLEGSWTFEDLNAYLAHPAQVIPGTEMGDFRGISDIQERADLIVYLRTLSDDPVPLP
jgi:cytochrome c